jgi:hypothetical protein
MLFNIAGDVGFLSGNGNPPRLRQMLELAMAATNGDHEPAIALD